ncbi:glycosyltransferase [Flavobacterium sp. TN-1]
MALEGNDVASNLKWVMSSNSIAVMPKPTYETWFMEGKLIPDFHYIEVNADFSNLEEKINYYIENPSEAIQIIKNANTYCKQFYDSKREKLIGLLVMKKYFEKTNQI